MTKSEQEKFNFQANFDYFAESKLNKILGFIERNLEEEISLEDLAKEAGMSVFYFARMFKQATGKSPYQSVVEKRIDRAKNLLAQTQTPLTEIALGCGWSNQSRFTTAFKQKIGVTPAQYRLFNKLKDG